MAREKKKKSRKALKKPASESQRKKLLIATDNFLPRWDGISRFLSEIIPRLKKDYDITVIAPDYGKTGFDKAAQIIKMPLSSLTIGDYTSARADKKKIKKAVKASDVVFTQTIGPIGYAAIKAAKKKKKKIISFIHSIEWELVTRAVGISILMKLLNIITQIFARRAYNKSSLLIVPSENIAEMLSWKKIKTNKEVIHLGVDVKKFVPPKDKDDAKKKLGIDSKSLVIGHHGRLAREKDLFTLLRAFIMIKKDFPEARLIVIGEGVDAIKKKLAGVKGVILPGSTNNVIPYLQAMDIYCLPSLTETTSLSTLEAMSCGVPVIATKVGFVKDYISNGRNGLFFREQNSYDLARKITMLASREKLRQKISQEARKTVEKEFSWDKTAREIEKVIEGMV